jgi:ketosteroid isomerase-like protein
MQNRKLIATVMDGLARADRRPLYDAMAEDVTWRWMGGIYVDGDHVIVEHSGRNQTPDGRPYNNNYCWVFTMRDGLISEVREYMDTQLVTETFTGEPS